MISRLTGVLIEKQAPYILIDIHGVAYELEVSMPTFYTLPALGENVCLHTHLVIREDAHLLYGFADVQERSAFRQLIKVSGIGSKTALGILSTLGVNDLAQAVNDEDVKRLSSAPSVGKKTAERLILELRGKLAVVSPNTPNVHIVVDRLSEVVATLLALGYTEREAKLATKGMANDIDVGEGVRLALKNLMKSA